MNNSKDRIVGNFQFSDTCWGNPIPEKTLNVQNNVSTTFLDAITVTGTCKYLYVYDNSSGAQDGTIENNSNAWVAQIEANKFATLQAAINADASGETVTLLSDIELTETLNVTGTVTLDLSGRTISGTDTAALYSLIHVKNGADLTVVDSSANGAGKITYAAGDGKTGVVVWVEGKMTPKSGIIEITGDWFIGFAADVRPNAWGTA